MVRSVLHSLLEFSLAILGRLGLLPFAHRHGQGEQALFVSEQSREKEQLRRMALYRDYVLTARFLTGLVMGGVGSTDGLTPQKKRPSPPADPDMAIPPAAGPGEGPLPPPAPARRPSQTSVLRGIKAGTIQKVRASLLLLLLEPAQALSTSSSSPSSSSSSSSSSLSPSTPAAAMSLLGDSVFFLGAGPSELDSTRRGRGGKPKMITGAGDTGGSGSSSRLGALRDRFTRHTTTAGLHAAAAGLRRRGVGDGSSSSTSKITNAFGSAGSGKVPVNVNVSFPWCRYQERWAPCTRKHRLRPRTMTSVQFLPSLLCWCQERDDNDVARRESALIMALIYNAKPAYSTDLLPPVAPASASASSSPTSGSSTSSKNKGLNGAAGRGGSYDEEVTSALVGAMGGAGTGPGL